ncbi:MAG: Oxygen-independent coproporphyrinogen III oxidase [Myxococcota bacterium]|nr:Oxygen-independent coproporphyrinogen III oxidase [Myxococcota bacterium]
MKPFEVNEQLLLKYDRPGPRYTSYPTAPVWKMDFGAEGMSRALDELQASGHNGVALYVHVPFCREMCSFCACNSMVTSRDSAKDHYLDAVEREIAAYRPRLENKQIVQLHFGGGTPTFLTPAQLARLTDMLQSAFHFAPGHESSVEADPAVTRREHLEVLRERGFSRISFGVQDFTPAVQKAINRVQSIAETEALMQRAKELGYRSINLDLVYGLPYQTVESFSGTIRAVIGLGPGRLAMYSYAHVPWMNPHQNKIPVDALPGPQEKIRLYMAAYHLFTEAGFLPIGMDHFARAGDDLGQALENQGLHRNFMGYTTIRSDNLLGLGVSSISEIAGSFAQNHHKLKDYYHAVDSGGFATGRGFRRGPDDERRRWVILRLMCDGELSFGAYRERFGEDFQAVFAGELARLREFVDDGLLAVNDHGLRITGMGRLVMRNICMVFDAYLPRKPADKPMFSRTI